MVNNRIRVETDIRTNYSMEYLADMQKVLREVDPDAIARVISLLEEVYQHDGQVLIAGNGGSAATASHMACDLGKSIVPLKAGPGARGFRAISLTDNLAWMTAIANDIGYEEIFSEQLRTLMHPGDLFFAISASGNSPNVVKGAQMARKLGGKVASFLGFDGGQLKDLSDVYVLVERDHYGYVEDVHMLLDHLITGYFQRYFQQWRTG